MICPNCGKKLNVKKLALVGLKEIADLIKRDQRWVGTYRKRGRMPEPIAVLACGPVWSLLDPELQEFINKYKKLSTTE